MAIAFISGLTAVNASSGTVLTTATFDSTGANFILCAVGWDNGSAATVTITDSKGNSGWAAVAAQSSPSGNNTRMQLFQCVNPTSVGTSHTVTFTLSVGNSDRRMGVACYSGANTTAPADQYATPIHRTATSDASSNTVTPSTNNQLLFGFNYRDGGSGSTMTAQNGFTERAEAATAEFQIQDLIQTTSSTVASRVTLNANSDVFLGLASFKEAGASFTWLDMVQDESPRRNRREMVPY